MSYTNFIKAMELAPKCKIFIQLLVEKRRRN